MLVKNQGRMMARRKEQWEAKWPGRKVQPSGRRVRVPIEVDVDPERRVELSVPLSKIDALVASLYNARKAALRQLAREEGLHPADLEMGDEDDVPSTARRRDTDL